MSFSYESCIKRISIMNILSPVVTVPDVRAYEFISEIVRNDRNIVIEGYKYIFDVCWCIMTTNDQGILNLKDYIENYNRSFDIDENSRIFPIFIYSLTNLLYGSRFLYSYVTALLQEPINGWETSRTYERYEDVLIDIFTDLKI